MGQDAVFQGAEADRWWQRNAAVLHDQNRISSDPVLRMLAEHHVKPVRVLEIGCANGWRLGELRARYGCMCVGVDPSGEALADGKKLFPAVDFRKAVASALPFDDETFDLVLVTFVLHWVERESLARSIEEIDRVVSPGGLLVVSDFLPDAPTKRPYHHLPEQEVYTFKEDYSLPFLARGTYQETARSIFHHATGQEEKDIAPDDRGFCSLLRKSGTLPPWAADKISTGTVKRASPAARSS